MIADASHLLRLLAWLSPAFPVGSFAYSHGIERAIHDGLIGDRATLTAWLEDLLMRGSAWNDAVLLAESWRSAGTPAWEEVAELAEALAGSRERHLETMQQGEAFGLAVAAWSLQAEGEVACSYPVAVGLHARRQGIGLPPVLLAYLHAFASNLIQGAVRLVPLGQRDGLATLAALEPVILATAGRAECATRDDLGSCAMVSEIVAMKHETQYSRVFRT